MQWDKTWDKIFCNILFFNIKWWDKEWDKKRDKPLEPSKPTGAGYYTPVPSHLYPSLYPRANGLPWF